MNNMNDYSLTAHNFYEEYSQLSSVLASPIPVSTLRFDDSEELLWQGNLAGHVSSHYSEQLTKYTSFGVGTAEEQVLQVLTGDFGVLCLTKDELKLRSRRGLPVFSYESTTFRDTLCMAQLPSQLILLGGHSNSLIEFDIQRQRQMRITDLSSNENGCCLIRRHPKFICCADLNGRVTLRDSQSLSVCHSFSTHSGSISDFDVHGNYLITCGYSNNRPSPVILVYDLRICRLVAPIQSVVSPVMLRFIPAFTSRFCLVSHVGQFQLLDVASTAGNCTAYTHRVRSPTSDVSITAMEVSSSGQAIAFGDSSGVVSLFGTNTSVAFNQYSRPTEFADPMESVPPIDINDNITPLTVISQPYAEPYFDEKLLSDDFKDFDGASKHYRIPKIDDKIIESMNQRGDVGYAPNPFKNVGRISYIRGRIGVVGVTKISDDDYENREEPTIELKSQKEDPEPSKETTTLATDSESTT